jgi:hypothetical protein
MKEAKKRPLPLPVRAARVLKRLENVRWLDEGQKSLHALGLAATPQERWDIWENNVRSFGYWKPLKRKKSATS